jgi:hypothetical protein
MRQLTLILSLAALLPAAELVSARGEVSVRRGGKAAAPLRVGERMGGGDLLITGEGGFARLKLRDESVASVGANSRYLLSEDSDPSDRSGTKTMLVSGSIQMDLSRIKKLYAVKSESHKFYTPTAICGVRGTQFTVYSDKNGRTRTRVTEGEVAVSADVLGDDARVSGGKPIAKGGGFASDKGGALDTALPKLPADKDAAKSLSGKVKPDPEYEAFYLGLIQDLSDRITGLKARFDGLKADAVRLSKKGEDLVRAGKAPEAAAPAEEARLKGLEQFLVRKEIVHRTHQYRGYLALLENSALNLPQTERLNQIYLEITR